MDIQLSHHNNISKHDTIWPNITCNNNSPWPSCLSLGTAFVTIAFMLIVMLVNKNHTKDYLYIRVVILGNRPWQLTGSFNCK